MFPGESVESRRERRVLVLGPRCSVIEPIVNERRWRATPQRHAEVEGSRAARLIRGSRQVELAWRGRIMIIRWGSVVLHQKLAQTY